MIWILLHSICQITVQINIYISFATEIILSTEPRVLVSEFSTQLRHFLKFQWLFPVILIESHVNDVMNGLISSVNVVLKSVGLEFLSVIGVFLVSGPTGNQKEIEAHHTVTFNDDGDSISVDNSVSGYSQDNSMLFPLSYSQNSHCIHSFKDCINYVHEKWCSEQFTLS